MPFCVSLQGIQTYSVELKRVDLKAARTHLILSSFLVCFTLVNISGQSGTFDLGESSRPKTDTLLVSVADTSDVYFFYPRNPGQEYSDSDTLLGRYFLQYDPSRQQEMPYGNLGNLGTAVVPLSYQLADYRGFHVGIDPYSLYRFNSEDFAYLRSGQPLTRAYFSQGNNQENTYFKLQFSRNFIDGFNLNIQYQRINNQGLYTYQRAINNALGFGLWYKTPKQRYQAFLTYFNHSHDHENNLGISAEPRGPNGLPVVTDPITLSVRSQSATTAIKDNEWRYIHYYKLRSERDSSQQTRRAILIHHQAKLLQARYKFFDETVGSQAFSYGPLLVDERGLRHYLEHRQLTNEAKLVSYKPAKPDSTGTLTQRDLIEIGLEHRWHRIYQEPQEEESLQNLFLKGRIKWAPTPSLLLDVQAYYALGVDRNTYRLEGKLLFDLKKLGNLEANLVQQRIPPTRIQERLYVSQQLIWDNDFVAPFETQITGKYELPQWRLSVQGRYQLINNLIYFDQNGLARQADQATSILGLSARWNLKWWKLHLDNWAVAQQTGSTEIQIPNLFTQHSLYFYGPLFKEVMLAKIGFDFRFLTDYPLYAYQPLTGQFYLQTVDQSDYPLLLDFFLGFKVQKFRFQFRFENLLTFLLDDYYYFAADHPIPQFGLRFGIAWEFLE